MLSAPWDLVIVGDGELRPEIETAIARFDLGQSVHLAGAKSYSDIPAYYVMANAFIHASTTEQWGLVVNEAMASGLPVLVSNRCGCAQDLVQEGVNGFTFDPYNVEAMAQKMFQLSTLNSQLSTMCAASQRIISAWGPERFADGLQSAVRKALAVGPIKPTMLQRVILKILLNR
jgi:glycosyltransferase involved in cell wall biosynthesis